MIREQDAMGSCLLGIGKHFRKLPAGMRRTFGVGVARGGWVYDRMPAARRRTPSRIWRASKPA
jgi:hypothetical protein